ncbi:MAG: hypothetical protein H6697_11640 [Myxococcales bacterium]|nr:hypothetical protein [Myxococcales bacterium]
MIIVTGTKRSGTSMWMQILGAAGIPVLGAEFSSVWKETIFEANPHGFFESSFRRGIYYATNPDPKSGVYIHPVRSRGIAVKVFVPGLCRSDFAYLGRVIGTVRHWREYGTSLDRLLTMEAAALEARTGHARPERPRVEPLLEWWLENFLLIRDIATRQYPARLISYARIVDEPATWIPRMIEWLGRGDVEKAVAAVDPEVRTSFAPNNAVADDLDPKHVAAFDLVYAAAHDGIALGAAELALLNEVHTELVGRIEAQLVAARRFEAQRRAALQAAAAKRAAAAKAAAAAPTPDASPSPQDGPQVGPTVAAAAAAVSATKVAQTDGASTDGVSTDAAATAAVVTTGVVAAPSSPTTRPRRSLDGELEAIDLLVNPPGDDLDE